ncbi:glycine zipper 2TM domain-containing protein [Xanthomonadaceae bacterium JHOS43]|nr:glycine zipper 2TM domain-containing protein [Xanthomonadaceae bacterium JHOS43]MCX7564152.1 glycine zipper 2TM domain-containing protein [Xanthomonadaceae bacterium XH05]
MRPRLLIALIATLLLAACATPRSGYYSPQQGGYYGQPPSDGYARCRDCGVVERIDRVHGERQSGGGGAVLGGIIGGIVGNQIGSGSGRAAATAAGAIAGGVIGNNAERNSNAAPWYELYLRMDDGRRIVVSQRDLNGIREGAYIRISNGRAYLN